MTNNSPILVSLRLFLIIAAILIMIGLLFVYSASYVYALELFCDPLFFVKKQLLGLLVGIAALLTAQTVSISRMKKNSFFVLLFSLILVALTLLSGYGRTIHGASRWLSLGLLSFQPSELLKISLIMYVARFLERKNSKHVVSCKQKIFFCTMLISTCFLLLRQPDFGMTVTLIVTTIMLFFIAHAHIRHIVMMLVALGFSALYLVFFRTYRLQRILTFLDPWRDPQGAGFQIIQSLIAIGSGSWFGTGIAHSRQKFFYLPMQHTDFIFSIIAEETGFFGALFLVILFLLLLYYGMRIAHQLHDPFCSLVVMGFTLIIALQAGINIAVTIGLVPTKGIGLPFISYGNTALVCYLFMIGVIINMVHSDKKYS